MAQPNKRQRKNPSPVRQWFLTYSQSGDLTKEEVLDNLRVVGNERGGIEKYIVCKETHEDGNPHIHAYVKFGEPGLSRSDLLLFDCGDPKKHGRYESCRSPKCAIGYCQKEDADFLTNLPASALEDATARRRARNALLHEGNVSDLLNSGDISYLALPQLQRARSSYLTLTLEAFDSTVCRGVWISGKPGTGKSHFVRQFSADNRHLYVKPQTRWWDGYSGQPVVLLDDFDCKVLSHHIKIWTDKYHHRAEIKGATIPTCYRAFFITSNYEPEQLWPDDAQLCAAVRRRCIFLSLEAKTEGNSVVRSFTRVIQDQTGNLQRKGPYSLSSVRQRLLNKFSLTTILT